MRCFVAIEIDEAWRRALLRLIEAQRHTARDLRWCTREQLHITLKFLGEVADDQLPSLLDVVESASRQVAPFAVRLGELGCFPQRGAPRVLWAGAVDEHDACGRWLSAAEAGLAELGFAPEMRAFHPHLTLARSRSRSGGGFIRDLLREPPVLKPLELAVARVTLFESRLGPGGAKYVRVAAAALKPSA